MFLREGSRRSGRAASCSEPMVGSRAFAEGSMNEVSTKMSRVSFLALLAAVPLLFGSALGATEFGAIHVVFEKATKLKRVETSLLMSFLDQSTQGDQLGAGRRLGCSVVALGTTGEALPARGEVTLRLEGAALGSLAPWKGSALSEVLDPRGDVVFDAEGILGLVNEAIANEAEPALFRIDFDGGKGKKVAELTLDCVHEPTGGAI